MTDIILEEVFHSKKPLVFRGKNVLTPPGIVAGYIIFTFASFAFLSTLVSIWTNPNLLTRLILLLFFLIVGIVMAFAKEVFILDPIHKVYIKSDFHLVGKGGNWKKLPDIEAVKVIPKNYSYTVQDAITPTMNFTELLYKVMLFVKDAERGIIVSYYKKDEAIKVAEEIGKALNVEIEVL